MTAWLPRSAGLPLQAGTRSVSAAVKPVRLSLLAGPVLSQCTAAGATITRTGATRARATRAP